MVLGQDLIVPNLYPPTGPTTGYLNYVITTDTAGAGASAWQVGTRVYVLQRNGIYPWNKQLNVPAGRHIRIRSEYRTDSTMPQIWLYDVSFSNTRPPANMINVTGDATLSNILVSGFQEDDYREVDGVQGQLIGCPAAANGSRFLIDSCIMKSINGQILRTVGRPSVVRVTNSIFADMGNLATSNLGVGQGVDLRDNMVDTCDIRNTTFVNSLDRIIRHYQSKWAIRNLWFNNNTCVNGLSYHAFLSLGKVDSNGTGTVQIKNNLLIDHFALGYDTCANRQREWSDGQERDSTNGAYRMTWLVADPYGTGFGASGGICQPTWDIENNWYTQSDSGAVVVSGWMMKPYRDSSGAYNRSIGPSMTWNMAARMYGDGLNVPLQIPARDTLLAFRRAAVQPVNVPSLMTNMIRWFYRNRNEEGAGKSKGGDYDPNYPPLSPGIWKYDYNRKPASYYLNDFNCNFKADTILTGVGSSRWSQIGGLPDSLQTRQHLYQGWNLVALPRLGKKDFTGVVKAWPSLWGSVYRYDTYLKSYQSVDYVKPGEEGVWVNYSVDAPSFSITGVAHTLPLRIPVTQSGWVLVGGRTWPTPKASLKCRYGNNAVSGSMYRYNPVTKGYDPVTVITPGEACWVNIQGSGAFPDTIDIP